MIACMGEIPDAVTVEISLPSRRSISSFHHVTTTAAPSGLLADQLHRGFALRAPKYAKASLAVQNSVIASLRSGLSGKHMGT
jgi:hypothetical protein